MTQSSFSCVLLLNLLVIVIARPIAVDTYIEKLHYQRLIDKSTTRNWPFNQFQLYESQIRSNDHPIVVHRKRTVQIEQTNHVVNISVKLPISSNRHDAVMIDDQQSGHADNPGIVLRITSHAFDYILKNLARLISIDVHSIKVSNMTINRTNMHVHTYALSVSDVQMPTLSHQLITPNTIEFRSTSGRITLLGRYHSRFKTQREGSFHVNLSNIRTSIALRLYRTIDGKLQLFAVSCRASIGTIEIDTNPKLFNGLLTAFETQLRNQLAFDNRICTHVHSIASQLNDRFANISDYRSLPYTLKFDHRLIIDPIVHNRHIDIHISGESVQQCRHRINHRHHTPFHPHRLHTNMHKCNRNKMINVYLSDYVFNSFMYQLQSAGQPTINLHSLQLLQQMLRLECEDNEKCLGNYVPTLKQNYIDQTGHLIAKTLQQPPHVEFNRNGVVHLSLNLTIELSYFDRNERRTSMLQFNLVIKLRIDQLIIIPNQYQYRNYLLISSETISIIDQIHISSIESIIDEIIPIVDRLHSLISVDYRSTIETAIGNYLRTTGRLSIDIDDYLPAIIFTPTDMCVEFAHNTMQIGFDINVNEDIYSFLQLIGSR